MSNHKLQMILRKKAVPYLVWRPSIILDFSRLQSDKFSSKLSYSILSFPEMEKKETDFPLIFPLPCAKTSCDSSVKRNATASLKLFLGGHWHASEDNYRAVQLDWD